MRRRKSHDGSPSPDSYAIKSFALEEVVRSRVDNYSTGYGQAARRDRVQRQRFEDQQIAPSPGNHITCRATHGLDGGSEDNDWPAWARAGEHRPSVPRNTHSMAPSGRSKAREDTTEMTTSIGEVPRAEDLKSSNVDR